MLNVSNAFNEAFKSDLREVKMRIKINDITYTDEDIISFNYNSSSIVGETYAIGSTFANSIKLTLCKIVEGLKQLDVVKPEMGIVLPNGSTEFVKLGTFLISEEVNPDRNENRTSLECTDQMLMLDDNYESKLSYPAPINAVALEIANLAGVKVDKVSFGRLRQDKIEKPEGYTFRQAIGLIAQFEAGYVTFDREGLLAIKQLTDKNFEITPNEYFLKGLVKNELMFRPSGIQVKTGENEADVLSIGSKKGSVIKLENKLMGETLLKSVYEKIKGVNYYPYTLSWRGNPAIEAGDWLYITDLKGNKFKVPNLSYTLEYKGGLTAKSSVESVASNEVKFGYKSVLDQTIEYVNDALKNADGNVVSYEVDEPQNPKEGDVWFKKVGPDTQIWVYERVGDTDKFEWVLKVDTAGNTEAFEKTKDIEKDLENSKQEIIKIREQAEKGIEKANQTIKDINSETQKELARVQAEADKALQESKDLINGVSGELSEQNKEIAEAKAKADKALQEGTELLNNVDSLKQTVDKQGLDIQKTNDSLKAQVAKVEGNTTQLANLKLESDKLSSAVSETVGLVNGFKVGSRNYWAYKNITGNYYVNSVGDERPWEPTSLNKTLHKTENSSNIIVQFWNDSGKLATDPAGRINYYDKDKKFIGQSEPLRMAAEGHVSYKLNIPEKAYYFNSHMPDYPVKIQIELGTIPTDWKPAPEDLASEDEVSKLETSVNQTKDEINLKADKITVNSIKQTVDKNSSELKIANDRINLKAEKSEVNALNNNVKQQASELTVQSDMIKAQASKVDNNTTQLANLKLESDRLSSTVSTTVNKVENLKVGSRNYWAKSNIVGNYYISDTGNKNPWNPTLLSEKLYSTENSSNIIVQFWNDSGKLATDPAGRVNFYDKDKKFIRRSSPLKMPINGHSIYQLEIPENARYFNSHMPDFPMDIKIELGTVPTDWSIAPEDVANISDLSKLETSVIQTKDSINLKADKVDVDTVKKTVDKNSSELKIVNDRINLKAEKSEVDTINNAVKQQASELSVQSDLIKAQTSKVDGNTTQLANLKLESDRISRTVARVEEMDITNRNLFIFSNQFNKGLEWDFKKYALKSEKSSDPRGWDFNNRDFDLFLVNGAYTLTIEFIDVEESQYRGFKILHKDNRNAVSIMSGMSKKGTYKISQGFVIDEKVGPDVEVNLGLMFKAFKGNFRIKIEKGNNSTEFKLAPEDMATQQELSTVVQTVDSLTTVVQGKAEKSQIVQLSNQISVVVSDNKNNSSSINVLQGAIQSTVKKDDVISSINQSSERITLDARKIHITGDTTIANAAISSAAIRDLSADKINTGTLDARKVRVVGIDAGNITTGTLNAIHIAARSITADKLSSDAIRVGLNDFGRNMRLSPNTLEFYDSNTLTGKLTDSGQEYWYGNRFIGRTGQGSKYGDSSVRGVVNQLNYEGDYVSWSYKVNSYDSTYTSMFTLDPKGRFTGDVGIHMTQPLWLKELATGAGPIKIMKINWSGNSMPAIVSTSTRSGILFGYNQLFILHDNTVRPMGELFK